MKFKECKTPIKYHGKLLLKYTQIYPLRTSGNSPLCPTGHQLTELCPRD